MPVMDGYEATKQIRSLKFEAQSERVPVVALTASAFEENRQKVIENGCDEKNGCGLTG